MTYRLACSLTSAVAAILFGILLVTPGIYTAGYGVAADTGGIFMGRRAAPLFLGLGVMLWSLRDQTDVKVQKAMSFSTVLIFVGVAGTGIAAYFDGVANAIILLAAAGELLIAVIFSWLLWTSNGRRL